MQLNNIILTDRHNRPSVSQLVGLRTLFLNDGAFADPYEISSVSIFTKDKNVSPSTVLTSSNLISDIQSSSVKFRWAPSGTGIVATDTSFDTSNYVQGGIYTSGIFRESTGKYVVVLDGINAVSSTKRIDNVEMANEASAATTYIDIWTVKLTANSAYKVFINEFELFDDTFISVTEPLLLTTRARFSPTKITLGSTRDLKVTVDVTVENRNLSSDVRNIFNDSVLTAGAFKIIKLNEDPINPNVTVSGYADTSSTVDVTAANTLVWSFDTSILSGGTLSNLGDPRGSYAMNVQYTVLAETIISPWMYFTVV